MTVRDCLNRLFSIRSAWQIWLVLCGLLFSLRPAGADEILGARLSHRLSQSAPDDRLIVWVFLKDKDAGALQKLSGPGGLVSERALERRAHVLPPDKLVDESDLPVNDSYVRTVRSMVLAVRNVSRWFNAVSVVATPEQIARIQFLPFVRGIDLVTLSKRAPELPAPALPREPERNMGGGASTQALDYGGSFNQVNMINVPPLHDRGNSAQGVIIGVFDNGVRLLSHQAFDSLRPRILGMHDFVDHKESVVPNDPATNFGAHGVNTLSILGGYAPGRLIGPAYGASFILARTENDSSETPIEEDNWVAAVEWAESLGVQVTSTSLGYLTFDAGYTSLTWQDMDGRTALISRAATMAARKGVVVVNSAGNNGPGTGHNTLDAPADADSIITVGAVNASGAVASFSSRGPTVDGRIKPDVAAQGAGNTAASGLDSTGFITGSGTSFSCPLTAGVAALLLHDHPAATPMQILLALRRTASQAYAPDNARGWGIINAVAADDYLSGGGPGGLPTSSILFQNYPNPFNPASTIQFTTIRHFLPTPAHITLRVYDVLGRRVATLADGDETAANHAVTWDGRNSSGAAVASGVYFYRLDVSPVEGGGVTLVNKMILVR